MAQDVNMLISPERAKLIKSLANVDTVVLTTLIRAATAKAEKFTGRKFWTRSYDEWQDGDGSREIISREFPITSLTGIDIKDSDDTVTAHLGTAFRWKKSGKIQWSPNATGANTGSFPRGFQNINLKYVAGFTTIPEDIQQAVALTVDFMRETETGGQSVKSEKLGDYAFTAADSTSDKGDSGLPDTIESLLRPYKRIRVLGGVRPGAI